MPRITPSSNFGVTWRRCRVFTTSWRDSTPLSSTRACIPLPSSLLFALNEKRREVAGEVQQEKREVQREERSIEQSRTLFSSLCHAHSRLYRSSLCSCDLEYTLMVRNGRTSCSSPNIQQCPRKAGYRDLIIASPGHMSVFTFHLALLFSLLLASLFPFGLPSRSRLVYASLPLLSTVIDSDSS